MRRNLALIVATLALLQAWSVIGQDLTLDSPVEAPAALTDVLNGTDNETGNATVKDTNLTATQKDFLDMDVNESEISGNLSTTASQNDFLDLPYNTSLLSGNLSATASQKAFLDLEFNESLLNTNLTWTGSQKAFLLDQEEIEVPTSFYNKGRMMGT